MKWSINIAVTIPAQTAHKSLFIAVNRPRKYGKRLIIIIQIYEITNPTEAKQLLTYALITFATWSAKEGYQEA